MKVIDLLNKIANGEEVPKKIKYNNIIYSAKGNAIENFVDYCSDEDEWCFNHYIRYENLNDEVEILEDKEEKKILEEIECYHQYDECVVNDEFYQEQKGSLVDEIIIDKINEIIDYLKSKENEK